MPTLFKRTGSFQISQELIEKRPGWVAEILTFLKFVPLSVVFDIDTQFYQYVGISPKFDQLPLLGKDPLYNIRIETDLSDQIYRITVKKAVEAKDLD